MFTFEGVYGERNTWRCVMADSKHSMLSAVQSLLRSGEEAMGTGPLVRQVTTATSVLPTNPALHRVALGVIAGAYHFHLSQLEQLPGEHGLTAALAGAMEVVHSLLLHSPDTWSGRVLQWTVDVFTRVCNSRGAPQGLEEALRHWLGHSKLRAVTDFLGQCTKHLVEMGRTDVCVEMVVRECISHAPRLNWLLAHVISLHPSQLLPTLLEYTFSLPLHPHTPPFTAVGQTLEFLGHSNRQAVGACVMEVVEKVVRGEASSRDSWAERIALLLHLAPLCVSVLNSISHECLQLVTAENIRAIVAKASPSEDDSHDSHTTEDGDDGEVKSGDDDDREREGEGGKGRHHAAILTSDEGVVSALVEVLLAMRVQEAAIAITQLLLTYSSLADLVQSQEDAMEEGEIVRVSLVDIVREGCERVIRKLLKCLQAGAMYHLTVGEGGSVKGGGSEVEFAVGLQCGLQKWCHLMASPHTDQKCSAWLQEMVSSVCVSVSELEAAEAVATLLLHCQHTNKLQLVLHIISDVSLRHPNLVHSSLQVALARCCEGAKEEGQWLCENLWNIIQAEDGSKSSLIRAQFIQAVFKNLVSLSCLLCDDRGVRVCVGGRVLDVMLVLGAVEEVWSDISSQCAVLSNIVSFFYKCLQKTAAGLKEKGKVDVECEVCLGKCSDVVRWWVGESDALRIFCLTTFLETALSQEMSTYFCSTLQDKAFRRCPVIEASLLLPANQTLGLGPVHSQTVGSGSLFHSWQAGKQEPSDLLVTSAAHCTSHVLRMFGAVGGDTGLLGSALLDQVAPHLPRDSALWLSSDGPRSSLEWSISVKQQFDQNALLWHLILLIAQSGNGLVACEPIICSLLTVLTQHWYSSRCSGNVTSNQRELESSQLLVEALALAGWLPPPLSYCAELFPSISPHDLYLLLNAISTFIKDNLEEFRKGSLCQLKDTGYRHVLKGVVVKNIQKVGHLYAHYVM